MKRTISVSALALLISCFSIPLLGSYRDFGQASQKRSAEVAQTEKIDAVLARLEHKDGEAIDVYLPYRKPIFGKVKYGDLFATPGVVQVFSSGAV